MLVALIVFTSLVVTLGSKSAIFRKTSLIHTKFKNIAGLIEGSDVRLSGVEIGRVSDISFSTVPGDSTVFVDMALWSIGMERLRQGSKATIQTMGLLGKKYVEIVPGSGKNPIKDGDSIDGIDPASLTEALEKGGQIMVSIQKVAGSLEDIFASIKGEPGAETDLSRAITHIKNILAEVQSGGGALHSLIYDKEKTQILADLKDTAANVRQIVVDARTGHGAIHELVYGTKATQFIEYLTRTSENIDSITAEVKNGKGVLHSLIYEEDYSNLVVELRRAAQNIREITEKIERGEGTLGSLLVDPTIYEDVKKITGDVERSNLLKLYIRHQIKEKEKEQR